MADTFDKAPRMRILHVIASVDPRGGGPVEGVIQQALSRNESGSAWTHIACLDTPQDPWVKSCPVKVFALGRHRSRKARSWLRPLEKYGYSPDLIPWLKEHARDYDVVVVNGLWNFATFGARSALARSGQPYVVFTHGMLDPWFRQVNPLKHLLKQAFWLFNEGPLLKNARAVLFTTPEERDVSRGAFWPYHANERVVGYGTSDLSGDTEAQVAAFRSKLPALGSRPYILFLSRLHPKKGCDLLIKAFAAVASEQNEFDLVVAGPDGNGYIDELQVLAKQLGVEARIHWPGMLVGDEKWGAFRGGDAFILPSHQENFGIVVAEAMAAAKPVLITDKVNIWREVMAGGGGLVEPDNVAGAEALLRNFVAMSPLERLNMGQAARQIFLENFEIKGVTEGIVSTLREAAAQRRSQHYPSMSNSPQISRA